MSNFARTDVDDLHESIPDRYSQPPSVSVPQPLPHPPAMINHRSALTALLFLIIAHSLLAAEADHIIWRSAASVLSNDTPWEREAAHFYPVEVLPDPEQDRLRLYYLVMFRGEPERNVLAVAYSEDGRNWTKPDLGDGTNIVMRSGGNPFDWGFYMPSSILYDAEAENPVERWKLLYWGRRNPAVRAGYYLATSPDGYTWQTTTAYPVITNANDATTLIEVNPAALPGPRETTHLIYQQMWTYDANLPIDRDNLTNMKRGIAIWWADPWPARWIGPAQILQPDAADPADVQFYFMTPYHTSNGYGALVSIHHTGDQTMDLQLMFSADGWSWERALDRQPVLPLGAPGRFDSGMAATTCRPVQWRGETLIYYIGRATVHDGKPAHPGYPPPPMTSGIGLAVVDPAVLGLAE